MLVQNISRDFENFLKFRHTLFNTAQLGAFAIVSILLPHAGVAQFREAHCKIFASISESHLRVTSADAEVVVDC